MAVHCIFSPRDLWWVVALSFAVVLHTPLLTPSPPPIKGILYQLVLPFSPPADLQGTSIPPCLFFATLSIFSNLLAFTIFLNSLKPLPPPQTSTAVVNPIQPTNRPSLLCCCQNIFFANAMDFEVVELCFIHYIHLYIYTQYTLHSPR